MLLVGLALLIIAVVVAAIASGNDGDQAEPSPSAADEAPTAPDPVQRVRATAGAFTVKVTWNAPNGTGAPIERLDVHRNGALVAQLDADETTYVDNDVVPHERYEYDVIAVSDGGQSATAGVRTTTTSAPAGTAGLVGTFNVKLHATSHAGFSSFNNDRYTAGWRFTPVCHDPPCDTNLRDVGRKQFQMRLQRAGGTYTGSVTVRDAVSCNGHGAPATFRATVRVEKAAAVRGEWRVTSFTGTMSQYSSAQLGCASSSAQFALTGSALKR